MDEHRRDRLIREHLEEVRKLQAEEIGPSPVVARGWPPPGYYLLWHVVVGMTLGLLASLVSLLANVFGAPLFGKPALELIRIYLTFPMGERALRAENEMILYVGCLLYLCTGAVYGIVFHLVMSTLFNQASKAMRFVVATGIGLLLWVVNYYLVLSWLQPLLLGDNWIVRMVPVWVAVATHLAFAWTMLIGEVWGRFEAPEVGHSGGVGSETGVSIEA